MNGAPRDAEDLPQLVPGEPRARFDPCDLFAVAARIGAECARDYWDGFWLDWRGEFAAASAIYSYKRLDRTVITTD